jgi:hypothetical protein
LTAVSLQAGCVPFLLTPEKEAVNQEEQNVTQKEEQKREDQELEAQQKK